MPWMGKVTADFRWKICGLPKVAASAFFPYMFVFFMCHFLGMMKFMHIYIYIFMPFLMAPIS